MPSINIMQANLTILRHHGLWPTYLNGERDQYYRLKSSFAFLSIFVVWYGSTSHWINIIIAKKQNVTTELFDDLAISFTFTGVFYMFFLLSFKRKHIVLLLEELGDYSEFGKPEDAESINNKFNFYAKLYYWYCIAGATFYCALAQTVAAKDCWEKNEKFNRNEVCGYFTHMWLPFDFSFTPVYEIIGVLQYIATLYGGPAFTVSFLLFVVLQHLICKIRHLKYTAEEIFESPDLAVQKQRLINCIRYHQYIIRLSDIFNDCFGQISFLYITLATVVLAITSYQAVMEVSMGSLIHLGAWLISITFVCVAGQQLIDESESVGLAFYNLEWVDSSTEIKFMIKFIIMRAQKPLSLKALSFGEMSLATFMAIIKSTYQYLTLMLQMN